MSPASFEKIYDMIMISNTEIEKWIFLGRSKSERSANNELLKITALNALYKFIDQVYVRKKENKENVNHQKFYTTLSNFRQYEKCHIVSTNSECEILELEA